ncbi:MAG: type II toxin-antitoxin system Phd/YefM family antitoxin [Acidobacteria bacterium]|nr:type II toxin-antitoxin system Phd/YefM family antitoxin [Acidobacteriota bacterium]
MAVNIHEAKTRFSRLVQQVEEGGEVVIARAGKPVARLVAYEAPVPRRRVPGFDRGKVVLREGFEEPVKELED